jgi:hypothetical protein
MTEDSIIGSEGIIERVNGIYQGFELACEVSDERVE